MEKLSYNQWIYIKSLREKRQYWEKDYKDGDLTKIQASYLIIFNFSLYLSRFLL